MSQRVVANVAVAMQRQRRTPEEKTEALRLFTEFGPAEAARRTGIPIGTIASWANRAGVSGPDLGTMAPAVQARQISLARRKAAIAERLVTVAGKLLDRIDDEKPVAVDVKRLMDAVGVAMSTAHVLGPVPLAQPPAQPATTGEPPAPSAERERTLAVLAQLGKRVA